MRLPKIGVEYSERPDRGREPKDYNADEIRAIWRRSDALDPAPRAIYQLGLVLGQRPSEIANMEWDELDGSWWSLSARRTKNNRDHRVVFAPEIALDVLKEVPRLDAAHVFAGYRGKRQLSQLNAIVFANVRHRAKPRHVLRDSVATGMASLGVSVEDVGRVLNHAQPGSKVTQGYIAYAFDAEKRAMLKWERRLRAILNEKDEPKVVKFARG